MQKVRFTETDIFQDWLKKKNISKREFDALVEEEQDDLVRHCHRDNSHFEEEED